MKKKLRWALALLILIIGVTLLLLANYADRIIDPYVRSLLDQNKPLNHLITYRNIRINLVTQNININDVRMYPDSGLVKDDKLWMEIRVDHIRLTRFRIFEMLLHKSLRVGDIVLVKPEVELHLPKNFTSRKVREMSEDSTAQRAAAPLLTSISLNRIILDQGHFRLMRGDLTLARSDNINFVAQGISLKKNNEDEPIGYSYGDVTLDLSNIKLRSESGMYDMSIKDIAINKADSSLAIEGFRMEPKYGKKEFSEKLQYQDDRFDVRIGRLDIEKIGYRGLLHGLPLEIAALKIDNLKADIYRDKNIAIDPARFPLFYNELFLNLDLPLVIDSLMIDNSSVTYGEVAEGKEEAGEITLNDLSLHSFSLSNVKDDSSFTGKMRLIFNAKVMGQGVLDANLVLPLRGSMHNIECSGSVGTMALHPLNGMLEPAINMAINGGRLDRMTFHFTTNDSTSAGWMEFLYHDLDVTLKNNAGKELGFLSAVANAVASSDNPAPGKDLKSVEIGFVRNKNKGLINYVWKTLQSGIVRTIRPSKKYQINRKKK